jgi:phospholipid transport system substrate-binding protein
MQPSRRLLLAMPLAVAASDAVAAADAAPPAGVLNGFYGVLLAVMKQAKALSFDQRYARLAPAIAAAFNLPLMTRIAVGPDWTQLTVVQQQRLGAAFARYTISVYANRFDGYDGERFVVDPAPAEMAAGTLVKSRLVKSDGGSVELNYLMRQDPAGAWQIIDVYLDGTISQLATRRSEFVSVLQRSGADGLVQLIEQRTAALRPG